MQLRRLVLHWEAVRLLREMEKQGVELTVYKIDGITVFGLSQPIKDEQAAHLLKAFKQVKESDFKYFMLQGTIKFDESYTKEQGKECHRNKR